MIKASEHYTLGEEIANSLTHGIGAILSVAGLTVLVVYGTMEAEASRIVGVSVFGACLVLMYLASTLYHVMSHPPVKRMLRTLDHCAIYLLIAGTYTPFLLVKFHGAWSWGLFAAIWTIAVAGVVWKLLTTDRESHVSTALYVGMGWFVVIALKPAFESIEPGALMLLLMGGLAYTAGVAFYVWDRLPYNHAIWHLFVMTGSTVHFFAVMYYV